MSKEQGIITYGDGMVRRTDAQLHKDREQILDLQMQGYSRVEIIDMMNRVREYNYSGKMLDADVKQGRRQLQEHFKERMEALLAKELKRLDVAERLAWKAFRSLDETGSITEEVVDELREGNEELKTTLRRTVTQWGQPIVLGWFNKILDIQKERRRILHMYAPSSVTLIQTDNRKQVKVKSIMGFSPEQEWPSPNGAIEGEIVERDN